MTEETLEAGPVQRGLNPEKLAETLSVGWHKFIAEKRTDGRIGHLIISARDFGESPMFPQHSAIAESCGIESEKCIGGILNFQENGTFDFDDFFTPTIVGPMRPQQFEAAIRASNEQGYTIVSI